MTTVAYQSVAGTEVRVTVGYRLQWMPPDCTGAKVSIHRGYSAGLLLRQTIQTSCHMTLITAPQLTMVQKEKVKGVHGKCFTSGNIT